MSNLPPLLGPNTSLACMRALTDGDCGQPAAFHISWPDLALRSVEWDNSLVCQEHFQEALSRWEMGWRHRVLPACAMPGSRFCVAHEGDDEWGFPLTYCYHPFDAEHAVAEAEEALTAPLATADKSSSSTS